MKDFNLRQALAPMAVAALAFTSLGAYAVDGVLLIDQARVNAAGGFPYKISTSGSYRLASNLNLGIGGVNTTAIEVSDQGAGGKLTVTLDLNGFLIGGSPVCDFNGQGDVFCLPGGNGSGIRVDGNAIVSVTNGAIRGMGLHGIFCTGSCNLSVDGLVLANNGGSAVAGGAAASMILSRNTVFVNRTGISATRAILQGNVVEFNLLAGVAANNSTLWNNLISGNGGLGLAGPSNGYANNIFTFNNGGNSNPQVGAGSIQTSGNVCGTGVCP